MLLTWPAAIARFSKACQSPYIIAVRPSVLAVIAVVILGPTGRRGSSNGNSTTKARKEGDRPMERATAFFFSSIEGLAAAVPTGRQCRKKRRRRMKAGKRVGRNCEMASEQ